MSMHMFRNPTESKVSVNYHTSEPTVAIHFYEEETRADVSLFFRVEKHGHEQTSHVDVLESLHRAARWLADRLEEVNTAIESHHKK